jgi:hypothetical protein
MVDQGRPSRPASWSRFHGSIGWTRVPESPPRLSLAGGADGLGTCSRNRPRSQAQVSANMPSGRRRTALIACGIPTRASFDPNTGRLPVHRLMPTCCIGRKSPLRDLRSGALALIGHAQLHHPTEVIPDNAQ